MLAFIKSMLVKVCVCVEGGGGGGGGWGGWGGWGGGGGGVQAYCTRSGGENLMNFSVQVQ